jgi:hypothetical protein
MIGFQISVNGKPQYTIGIGELGILHAKVEWARLQTKSTPHEHLYLGADGMVSPEHPDRERPQSISWQNIRLAVGDKVTIKVVDTDSIDAPLPGLPDYPF